MYKITKNERYKIVIATNLSFLRFFKNIHWFFFQILTGIITSIFLSAFKMFKVNVAAYVCLIYDIINDNIVLLKQHGLFID